MKKILALVICLSSGFVFAGAIEAEWKAAATILTNKPFDEGKFVDSINKSKSLKSNIDYSTKKNNSLLLISIDINNAANSLVNDLDKITDNIDGILSRQNFTA